MKHMNKSLCTYKPLPFRILSFRVLSLSLSLSLFFFSFSFYISELLIFYYYLLSVSSFYHNNSQQYFCDMTWSFEFFTFFSCRLLWQSMKMDFNSLSGICPVFNNFVIAFTQIHQKLILLQIFFSGPVTFPLVMFTALGVHHWQHGVLAVQPFKRLLQWQLWFLSS